MDNLLYFRQEAKSFFVRNDLYLIPLLKFLTMLGILLMMNWHLGYRYLLMRWILVILVSLISCLLPWSGMTAMAAVYLLGHVSALSWEAAAILAFLMFAGIVLHFFFLPGGSFLIVLIPMAFYLKVPYLIPLLAGIYGSALAFLPVGIGTVMYFTMAALEESAMVLNDPGTSIVTSFTTVIQNLQHNRQMMLMAVVFIAATLIVNGFARLSIDYAKVIAIGLGGLVMLIGLLPVGILLGTETITIPGFLICVLCTAAAVMISLWSVSLDYNHTEKLQYEDDEYVYYVKAVPKIQLSQRRRTVHEIEDLDDDMDQDGSVWNEPEKSSGKER